LQHPNAQPHAHPSEPHHFPSVEEDELHPLTPAYPAARVLPPPLPTCARHIEAQADNPLAVLDEELHLLTPAQWFASEAA
jgi:hypothetical protein